MHPRTTDGTVGKWYAFLVVNYLVLAPVSALLMWKTEYFPSLKLQQGCVFAFGLLLVGLNWYRSRRFHIPTLKFGLACLGLVLYGVLASWVTDDHFSWDRVKYYAFLGYWICLWTVYVSSANGPACRILRLIRNGTVSIAVLAIVYLGLCLVLVNPPDFLRLDSGPYTSTLYNIDFSPIPWLGARVARFTFIVLEPRVLGSIMVLGLWLEQSGMTGTRRRPDPLAHRLRLACLLAGISIVCSYLTFASLGLCCAYYALKRFGFREKLVWLTLATGLCAAVLGVAGVLTGGIVSSTTADSASSDLKEVSNELGILFTERARKINTAAAFDEYFQTRIGALRQWPRCPFGRGLRFASAEELCNGSADEVRQSNNIPDNAFLHAGVLGLAALLFALRKTLSVIDAQARYDPIVVGASRALTFFLLIGLAIDLCTLHAWFYGVLILVAKAATERAVATQRVFPANCAGARASRLALAVAE